ncbi:hypothetical protein [Bifidobacterium sp.]|jgi:hypothetical protein|uniref:hypothetical protein n=1 Tax=Bifidobacterium sp. TaxID=41200 RepID=UPI0025C58082|nr:hypothetical protein [Bifidobacterium sp.]MCH4208946.1 hypothetical protein [Bifidobacterium sp.]MCI1225524.1 hypothetical protein [Bifidobacterium sp.]
MSWSSDVRLGIMQMEPPESSDALSQGMAGCALIFRCSIISDFPAISENLKTDSLGQDPLLLLVSRSSGIAKRYDSAWEPVPLVSAKDEHCIAGYEICRANLISPAKAVGFSSGITPPTDDYWGDAESSGDRHGVFHRAPVSPCGRVCAMILWHDPSKTRTPVVRCSSCRAKTTTARR